MLDMYTHIIAFLAPKSNGKLGRLLPPFLPVGAAELPFLPVGVRPTGLSQRSASRKQDGQDVQDVQDRQDGSRARSIVSAAEPRCEASDAKPREEDKN